jgi:hypothetical protein
MSVTTYNLIFTRKFRKYSEKVPFGRWNWDLTIIRKTNTQIENAL